MTIRELIRQLSEVDEHILNYEVWTTFRHQITPDIKITGRVKLESVPEHVDVDSKRIYLKSENK